MSRLLNRPAPTPLGSDRIATASATARVPLLAAGGNRALGRWLQARLTVNQPGDPYEVEADRVADQVMRMPLPQPIGPLAPATGGLMRCGCGGSAGGSAPCASCAEEEELHRRADGAGPGLAPPIVHRVLQARGEPLDAMTRAFMEPRFGADLGGVRVHRDGLAAESAGAVRALAYTVGPNVVFGAGQYQPQTASGRRLLAHELTHVLQQGAGGARLQRMSIGTGTPPAWQGFTLTTVPAGDLPRVNAAIAEVRNVVTHPEDFPLCHDFYARHCPSHLATALADSSARAVLWKFVDSASQARGGPDGNVAYTQSGYDQGDHGLATTLMHELLHVCGVVSDDDHFLADVAAMYCMGASRNQLTVRAGPTLDGAPPALLVGYRRFLTSWASGRISMDLGLDLNLPGLALEAMGAAGPAGARRDAAELGSLTTGFTFRPGWPWGGEAYGGLTGSLRVGADLGRFNLRPVRPTDPPLTRLSAGVILELGIGAEFFIPLGTTGRVLPITLEAAYRLIQPITPQAERIHEFVFGPTIPL